MFKIIITEENEQRLLTKHKIQLIYRVQADRNTVAMDLVILTKVEQYIHIFLFGLTSGGTRVKYHATKKRNN